MNIRKITANNFIHKENIYLLYKVMKGLYSELIFKTVKTNYSIYFLMKF